MMLHASRGERGEQSQPDRIEPSLHAVMDERAGEFGRGCDVLYALETAVDELKS